MNKKMNHYPFSCPSQSCVHNQICDVDCDEIVSCTGPRGFQGERGPMGHQGFTGPKGEVPIIEDLTNVDGTGEELNSILVYDGVDTWNATTNISLGSGAGVTNKGIDAIVIGRNAGATNAGVTSIAIGDLAGQSSQLTNAVAIGTSAGNLSQGFDSISIGNLSGTIGQGSESIAIGSSAGKNSQANEAIAIGVSAGESNQRNRGICIGHLAGLGGSSANSIYLGTLAGDFDALGGNPNSIVITADAAGLAIQHSGFYVTPVNEDTIGGVGGQSIPTNTPLGTRLMLYNPADGEVTYMQ